MVFLTWFEMMLITKFNQVRQEELIKSVTERLDIQERILSYFDENCLEEDEDEFPELDDEIIDEDFEIEIEDSGACLLVFEHEGEEVVSERRVNVIYTDIGDGRLMFKYDIMSDGSYKQTIMEE